MKFKLPENYIIAGKPDILNHIQTTIGSYTVGSSFHFLFVGSTGVGKTYLAKIIADHFVNPNNMKFKWLYASSAYREYLESKNTFDWDRLNYNLIIDDLGDENPNTDAAINFMGEIITRRYEIIKRGQGFNISGNSISETIIYPSTIITTNLFPRPTKKNDKNIEEVYGTRIISRIEEEFITMIFFNQSFRKSKAKIITN